MYSQLLFEPTINMLIILLKYHLPNSKRFPTITRKSHRIAKREEHKREPNDSYDERKHSAAEKILRCRGLLDAARLRKLILHVPGTLHITNYTHYLWNCGQNHT